MRVRPAGGDITLIQVHGNTWTGSSFHFHPSGQSVSKPQIHNIPISCYRDIQRLTLNCFRLEMEQRNKSFPRFQRAAPVSGQLLVVPISCGKAGRERGGEICLTRLVRRTLKQLQMVSLPAEEFEILQSIPLTEKNQKNSASVLRLLWSS